jgi:hypothetical protein
MSAPATGVFADVDLLACSPFVERMFSESISPKLLKCCLQDTTWVDCSSSAARSSSGTCSSKRALQAPLNQQLQHALCSVLDIGTHKALTLAQ